MLLLPKGLAAKEGPPDPPKDRTGLTLAGLVLGVVCVGVGARLFSVCVGAERGPTSRDLSVRAPGRTNELRRARRIRPILP